MTTMTSTTTTHADMTIDLDNLVPNDPPQEVLPEEECRVIATALQYLVIGPHHPGLSIHPRVDRAPTVTFTVVSGTRCGRIVVNMTDLVAVPHADLLQEIEFFANRALWQAEGEDDRGEPLACGSATTGKVA